MSDGQTVQEVERLAKEAAAIRVIGDKHFAPCGYQQIVEQVFRPHALEVNSLTALIGYVEENRDGLDLKTLMAHVVSPTRVELIGAVELVRQTRPTHLVAVADPKDVCTGWSAPDEFTIMLKTSCVPSTGDLDAVIKLAGNVASEQKLELQDDGMSQTVQQRAGVTLVERSDVPNPVELAPYRTFREVDQPVSPFLLRFATPYDRDVCAQLFECDGGAWQIEARQNVATYLREKLADVVVLA